MVFKFLKSEKSLQSANLLSNDSKVNLEVKEPRHPISESLSEDKIRPVEPLSESHQDNPSSNEDKGLHQQNFITSEDNFVGDVWQSPKNFSEDEKIEIIQKGFQFNQERKISLKKYYESTNPYRLFQYKGYSIKYEAIRKNKFYRQLKPSNN